MFLSLFATPPATRERAFALARKPDPWPLRCPTWAECRSSQVSTRGQSACLTIRIYTAPKAQGWVSNRPALGLVPLTSVDKISHWGRSPDRLLSVSAPVPLICRGPIRTLLSCLIAYQMSQIWLSAIAVEADRFPSANACLYYSTVCSSL